MSQTKHLLIESIYQRKIDRTPIWMMRQAGRYLPEYIKTKNQAGGFMKLIRIQNWPVRLRCNHLGDTLWILQYYSQTSW